MENVISMTDWRAKHSPPTNNSDETPPAYGGVRGYLRQLESEVQAELAIGEISENLRAECTRVIRQCKVWGLI